MCRSVLGRMEGGSSMGRASTCYNATRNMIMSLCNTCRQHYRISKEKGAPCTLCFQDCGWTLASFNNPLKNPLCDCSRPVSLRPRNLLRQRRLKRGLLAKTKEVNSPASRFQYRGPNIHLLRVMNLFIWNAASTWRSQYFRVLRVPSNFEQGTNCLGWVWHLMGLLLGPLYTSWSTFKPPCFEQSPL